MAWRTPPFIFGTRRSPSRPAEAPEAVVAAALTRPLASGVHISKREVTISLEDPGVAASFHPEQPAFPKTPAPGRDINKKAGDVCAPPANNPQETEPPMSTEQITPPQFSSDDILDIVHLIALARPQAAQGDEAMITRLELKCAEQHYTAVLAEARATLPPINRERSQRLLVIDSLLHTPPNQFEQRTWDARR